MPPTPDRPRKPRSSSDQMPTGIASSLHTSRTTGTMANLQCHQSPEVFACKTTESKWKGPKASNEESAGQRTLSSPILQTPRAASIDCEECASKDSVVQGSCQICGHESLPDSLAARRAARGALVCRAAQDKRIFSRPPSGRSSIGDKNCPDCKSRGGIHRGSCQICGVSLMQTEV